MSDADSQRRAFLAHVDVSRETTDRFDAYAARLKAWNRRINLVSAATVDELWTRHMLDSAQLFRLAGCARGRWVDLGSGGGFPGLVVALLAAEKAPGLAVTLVESDRRKAAFLQTTAAALGLQVRVLARRAEELPGLDADVISARALAPLSRLLALAVPHLAPGGQLILPKGAAYRREIDEALEFWRFRFQKYPSATDSAAVVLKVGEIRRA